jgi:predicted DNA-binding protein with PD1-like motif
LSSCAPAPFVADGSEEAFGLLSEFAREQELSAAQLTGVGAFAR